MSSKKEHALGKTAGNNMSEKWVRDTGLLILVVLAVIDATGGNIPAGWIVIVGVLIMFWPKVFWPVAWVWDRLVKVLALIMPKVFFSIVFFAVILPVGALKKAISGDTMRLRRIGEYKSAFVERNHKYSKDDLAMPF